jgi:DNA-binding MarR family transcriptional regulator
MPTLVALGEDYRGPDGRLGYLLRQAHQAMRAEIDRVARLHGLTAPQYSIMSVLDHEPGLSVTQIAHQSLLRPQTANEMIQALARQGMIERRPNPQDRRSRLTWLTDLGRERFTAVNTAVAALEAQALDGLDPAQASVLCEALVRCAAVLSARSP